MDSDRDSKALDAKWVCIQCPADYDNISGTKEKTIMLEVGDINFDGKIDNEDYMLLAQYTATGAGATDLPYNKANWTPSDKQLAVMNCRTDTEWHRQQINVDDAVILYDYINGIGGIVDLGLTPFKVAENTYYEESTNVSNLLIIDGHYDRSVNIPFKEFAEDDWAIHDKFFNYLLNMAIHKYSNSEDITYLEKLIKEAFPQYATDTTIFQTGIYTDGLRQLVKSYQTGNVYYTIGDLNNDNKLDYADLELERQYIDDAEDYNLVYKYLIDPVKYPLTPEEIERLDQDDDGVITENDLKILDAQLNKKYSKTLRARADIDGNGLVDEFDYYLLEQIVTNGYVIYTKDAKQVYLDLKIYDIPFQLGWLDVQTEKILEYSVNEQGLISEVSK